MNISIFTDSRQPYREYKETNDNPQTITPPPINYSTHSSNSPVSPIDNFLFLKVRPTVVKELFSINI